MAISMFPPGILSTIFSFVLDPSSAGPSYHKQYAFSQVCQSWRSIALADPTLWRVITTRTPPKWVPALIQRSQGTELDVELEKNIHTDTLQAVATQFSRIGILRICLYTPNFRPSVLHEPVQAISAQELPLRVLDVSSGSIYGFEDDKADPQTPLSEKDVAAIVARSPRLQELTLEWGANLLSNVPLPSSLTSLQLGVIQRLSLQTFLDALRRMPNLQGLHLGICGAKDGVDPLPSVSTQKVDLPHLASVTLYIADFATAKSFLPYLNFPAGRVHLFFENFPPTAESLPMIRYISDRFQHPEDQFRWPALRQLHIDEIHPGFLKFNLGLSSGTRQANNFNEWKKIVHQRPDAKEGVALSFHWPSNRVPDAPLPVSGIPLFIHLSRSLPLHDLKALHVEGLAYEAFTPQHFTDLFSNLPELVYLEAHGWNHFLWEALEKMQKGVQPPALALLPKLRYVRVDLRSYDEFEDNPDQIHDAGLNRIKAASGALKLARLELAYWRYESFGGVIPGFESLVDLVVYTNYGLI